MDGIVGLVPNPSIPTFVLWCAIYVWLNVAKLLHSAPANGILAFVDSKQKAGLVRFFEDIFEFNISTSTLRPTQKMETKSEEKDGHGASGPGEKRRAEIALDQFEQDLRSKKQKLEQARSDYAHSVQQYELHPDVQREREQIRAELRNKQQEQLFHQLRLWKRILDKEQIDTDVLQWLTNDAPQLLSCPMTFSGRWVSGRGQGPDAWLVNADMEAVDGDFCQVVRHLGSCEVFTCEHLDQKQLKLAQEAQEEPGQAKWKILIQNLHPTGDLGVAAIFLIVYSKFLPEFA